MFPPTNPDKKSVAAKQTMRRGPRGIDLVIVASIEEESVQEVIANTSGDENGQEVVAFYGDLNDAKSSPDQHDNRTERRRAARHRRGGDRPCTRPDASGRIGKKECHLFAFVEQLEEQVAETRQ